jgi:hypothetical protein
VNDAKNVRNFLISTFKAICLSTAAISHTTARRGFKSKDIVLLTDESLNPRQLPTRKNMMDAMYWLVRGARMDDSLFFHCTVVSFFLMHVMTNRSDFKSQDTEHRSGMMMEMKSTVMTKVRCLDNSSIPFR